MTQTKEILKQVKKIELSTKQLVDSLLAGNYHSIFKGQGIEFSEIREYRPGDDIRSIDWNVTARFNQPFVKEFIEERDLQVCFVVDMSDSGLFGNRISKKRRMIEIVATLMFAALRNNDKVGMFLFTDKIEKFIPFRKGKKHILKILVTLLTFRPNEHMTNIENSLIAVSKIIKKRSIVFIISDFFDSSDFLKPLSILSRNNDIIIIRIVDSREKELPSIGLIELEDEETGEQILVDTSDPNFQKNYFNSLQKKESELLASFQKLNIDYLSILSDEKFFIPMKKFFKTRSKRH